MLDTYGIGSMKQEIMELLKEKSLGYYGILTNCLDRDTREYKKEILLY